MSFQQMIASETNPNNECGGGGCACDGAQQTDCKGPYVVFYGNSMADLNSPHVVMGAACIKKAQELLDGELAVVGEREYTYRDPIMDKVPPVYNEDDHEYGMEEPVVVHTDEGDRVVNKYVEDDPVS